MLASDEREGNGLGILSPTHIELLWVPSSWSWWCNKHIAQTPGTSYHEVGSDCCWNETGIWQGGKFMSKLQFYYNEMETLRRSLWSGDLQGNMTLSQLHLLVGFLRLFCILPAHCPIIGELPRSVLVWGVMKCVPLLSQGIAQRHLENIYIELVHTSVVNRQT